MFSERSSPPRGAGAALLAIVLGAFVLRLLEASWTSLWLDDFHSLHHARALGTPDFWEGLLRDNHPPLWFLVLGAVRAIGGEHQLLLAAPAVLCGTLAVALSTRLVEGSAARVLTALVVTLATLHLEASANLRMYALLSLAVLGLLLALVRVLEHGRGVGWLVLAGVVGLHTHYQFVHALVLLAGCALLFAWTRERARLRPLLLGLTVTALLAAPWYALGLPAQLEHGLAPGGNAVTLRRLAEGYLHLTVHGANEYARPGIALVPGVGLTLLALFGAWTLPTTGRALRAGVRPALLVTGALVLPAWVAAAAWIAPRSGYDWRYLIGAVAPFAALIATGATAPGRVGAAGARPHDAGGARLRRLLAPGLVGLLAYVTYGALRHPGHEDYRSATAAVLAEARDGDAVLAADWQPRLFPHALGWRYYAERRLAGAAPPPLLGHTDDFTLAPGVAPERWQRVFCVLRSVPGDAPALRTLRAEFPSEESRAFGRGVHVVTFSR